MSVSSNADLEPAAIPLPQSEDTQYSSSPHKRSSSFQDDVDERGYESTSHVTRRSARKRAETPVSPASNPFQMPGEHAYDPEETPRPQPSRRGGKYHPGTRPRETPMARHSSPGTLERHSSDRSSGSASDHDEQQFEEEATDSESEMETDGFYEDEDMDRTIAINLDSSVAHQLGGPISVTRRRLVGASSPGRTPAKRSGNRNMDFTHFTPKFTPGFAKALSMHGTPENGIRQKLFGDVENTPFLTAASPKKLNALQRLAELSPTQTSYDLALQEKDEEIRELKEMLASSPKQQTYEDFIDFSPEKRMSVSPQDLQLSIKKRRSPHKNGLSSPALGSTSNAFKSSPAKRGLVFLEEVVQLPTAEERKRARRRRVTQEFREFSAIDLETLRSYLPLPVMPEVTEEASVPVEQTNEEAICVKQEELEVPGSSDGQTTEVPIAASMVKEEQLNLPEEGTEGTGLEVHDFEEIPADALEGLPVKQEECTAPAIEVPPTPANRIRLRRAGSAPPVPQPAEDPYMFNKPVVIAPMDEDDPKDEIITTIQKRVVELEEKLVLSDVQFDRVTRELITERRLRLQEQELRQFLELERKFGVCCDNGHGAHKPQDKLGPAAIQLPDSPTGSMASSVRGSSVPPPQEERKGMQTKSRFGRPLSRLERPPTRTFDRPATRIGGGLRGEAVAPKSTIGVASRKRVREEPAVVPGNKPPVPPFERPGKRVLSSSNMSGNIAPGSSVASGLAKKPEKPAGRSLRNAATTTAMTTRGLARGARR
jgi:hypothetical protein